MSEIESESESFALLRKVRHTVAALRGVRGLASLPERATEQNSHGSTHRWLVGRMCVGWTLWTLRTLWSVWTLWLVWTSCTVWLYGVYGRRRGAQLTNFLFASTCILVFEHRAHVFPCKSRFRVFFPPRSFRRPRAFSPFPLKRVRGKKKKERKRERKRKRKIRIIRSLANRIFQLWRTSPGVWFFKSTASVGAPALTSV